MNTESKKPDHPPQADEQVDTPSTKTFDSAGYTPENEDLESSPIFAKSNNPDELGSLGPYRLLKELGRGGMGAVYLGFDQRLNRKVAIKMMLPKYASMLSSKARFLREARAAAGITNDHIVTIHEADERDGTPYLVMQFLEGYPLDEYLKQMGTLPLTEVLRIGRETALGLAAAHKIGLVHRDIKPANLWVETPSGRIKLLDFGLAKPTQSETNEKELTATGAVMGTPAYMAPEQALGEEVNAQADLFSLGVLLYRLSCGRAPFQGKNAVALISSVITDEPTPIREINPAIPESFSRLIHDLLQKKPELRPKSADLVVDTIRLIEAKQPENDGIQPDSVIPIGSTLAPTKTSTSEIPAKRIDALHEETEAYLTQPTTARKMPKWPFVVVGLFLIVVAYPLMQVIKITTPKGTLVIESEDDKIEIVVKKGSAKIFDKTKQREIELAVGDDYMIELAEPKDGLKLSTKKFEITRDGKTLVKVRVEKTPEATDVAKFDVRLLEAHGVSPAGLKEWSAKLPKGYRPTWVAARGGSKEPLFDAVAGPDSTDWELNVIAGETKQKYFEMKDTHQLLLSLTSSVNVRLWVKSGEKDWYYNYGDATLVSGVLEARHKSGSLPISLNTYGKDLEYEVTFGPITGEKFDWFLNLTPFELAQKVAEYEEKGWRPHIVNTHLVSKPHRFLAVFSENKQKTAWAFSPYLTTQEYEKELADRTAKGQRPRCVTSHEADGEIGYTVIWEGGTSEPKATQESGPFLEVHGVSKSALEVWVARLPKGYRPSAISARTGVKELLFDGIAISETVTSGSKLALWSKADHTDHDELKKTHWIVSEAAICRNDVYYSFTLGTTDGSPRSYFYGTWAIVNEELTEGIKSTQDKNGVRERWLPLSLTGIETSDGTFTYSLVTRWLPDVGCEWHPSLTPEELTSKMADYRKKGWRPHIVNAINGSPTTKFLAVFLENKTKEEWEFTPNLTVAEYEKELIARKAKKQRPRCVSSHVTNGKVAYTVVWDFVANKP